MQKFCIAEVLNYAPVWRMATGLTEHVPGRFDQYVINDDAWNSE